MAQMNEKLQKKIKTIFSSSTTAQKRFKLLLSLPDDGFTADEIKLVYTTQTRPVIQVIIEYVQYTDQSYQSKKSTLSPQELMPLFTCLNQVLSFVPKEELLEYKDFLFGHIDAFLDNGNHVLVRKHGITLLMRWMDLFIGDEPDETFSMLLTSSLEWNVFSRGKVPARVPPFTGQRARVYSFVPRVADKAEAEAVELFKAVLDYMKNSKRFSWWWVIFKKHMIPIMYCGVAKEIKLVDGDYNFGFAMCPWRLHLRMLNFLTEMLRSKLASYVDTVFGTVCDLQLALSVFEKSFVILPPSEYHNLIQIFDIYYDWLEDPSSVSGVLKYYTPPMLDHDTMYAAMIQQASQTFVMPPDPGYLDLHAILCESAVNLFYMMSLKDDISLDSRKQLVATYLRMVTDSYSGAVRSPQNCRHLWDMLTDLVSRMLFVLWTLNDPGPNEELWEKMTKCLHENINGNTSPAPLQKARVQTIPFCSVDRQGVCEKDTGFFTNNFLLRSWRHCIITLTRMVIANTHNIPLTYVVMHDMCLFPQDAPSFEGIQHQAGVHFRKEHNVELLHSLGFDQKYTRHFENLEPESVWLHWSRYLKILLSDRSKMIEKPPQTAQLDTYRLLCDIIHAMIDLPVHSTAMLEVPVAIHPHVIANLFADYLYKCPTPLTGNYSIILATICDLLCCRSSLRNSLDVPNLSNMYELIALHLAKGGQSAEIIMYHCAQVKNHYLPFFTFLHPAYNLLANSFIDAVDGLMTRLINVQLDVQVACMRTLHNLITLVYKCPDVKLYRISAGENDDDARTITIQQQGTLLDLRPKLFSALRTGCKTFPPGKPCARETGPLGEVQPQVALMWCLQAMLTAEAERPEPEQMYLKGILAYLCQHVTHPKDKVALAACQALTTFASMFELFPALERRFIAFTISAVCSSILFLLKDYRNYQRGGIVHPLILTLETIVTCTDVNLLTQEPLYTCKEAERLGKPENAPPLIVMVMDTLAYICTSYTTQKWEIRNYNEYYELMELNRPILADLTGRAKAGKDIEPAVALGATTPTSGGYHTHSPDLSTTSLLFGPPSMFSPSKSNIWWCDAKGTDIMDDRSALVSITSLKTLSYDVHRRITEQHAHFPMKDFGPRHLSSKISDIHLLADGPSLIQLVSDQWKMSERGARDSASSILSGQRPSPQQGGAGGVGGSSDSLNTSGGSNSTNPSPTPTSAQQLQSPQSYPVVTSPAAARRPSILSLDVNNTEPQPRPDEDDMDEYDDVLTKHLDSNGVYQFSGCNTAIQDVILMQDPHRNAHNIRLVTRTTTGKFGWYCRQIYNPRSLEDTIVMQQQETKQEAPINKGRFPPRIANTAVSTVENSVAVKNPFVFNLDNGTPTGTAEVTLKDLGLSDDHPLLQEINNQLAELQSPPTQHLLEPTKQPACGAAGLKPRNGVLDWLAQHGIAQAHTFSHLKTVSTIDMQLLDALNERTVLHVCVFYIGSDTTQLTTVLRSDAATTNTPTTGGESGGEEQEDPQQPVVPSALFNNFLESLGNKLPQPNQGSSGGNTPDTYHYFDGQLHIFYHNMTTATPEQRGIGISTSQLCVCWTEALDLHTLQAELHEVPRFMLYPLHTHLFRVQTHGAVLFKQPCGPLLDGTLVGSSCLAPYLRNAVINSDVLTAKQKYKRLHRAEPIEARRECLMKMKFHYHLEPDFYFLPFLNEVHPPDNVYDTELPEEAVQDADTEQAQPDIDPGTTTEEA